MESGKAGGEFLSARFAYDGLHPKAQGYAVITEKILPLSKWLQLQNRQHDQQRPTDPRQVKG